MARWRELPYDVLLIIAEYLPAQATDALAAIDPFFLHLVLPRRYERVTIDRYDHRMEKFMKTRLRDPFIAPLVRRVDIGSAEPWNHTFKLPKTRAVPDWVKMQTTRWAFTTLLQHLPKLTTLRLSLAASSGCPLLYDCLSAAWPVMAPRLSELNIVMDFDHSPLLARLNPRACRNLERLVLCVDKVIFPWSASPVTPIAAEGDTPALADWIGTLAATASSFHLEVLNDAVAMLDQFYPARSAQPLAHLTRLQLPLTRVRKHQDWPQILGGLATFVRVHAPSLQEIALIALLEYTGREGRQITSCLEALPPCPSLRRFEIEVQYDEREFTTALASFVLRRCPALHELHLKQNAAHVVSEAFDVLVSALHARASKLRRLELCYYTTAPHHLQRHMTALRAAGLPPLEELVLDSQPCEKWLEEPAQPPRTVEQPQKPRHIQRLKLNMHCDEEKEEVYGLQSLLEILQDLSGCKEGRIVYCGQPSADYSA